jgi:hypothetical protein
VVAVPGTDPTVRLTPLSGEDGLAAEPVDGVVVEPGAVEVAFAAAAELRRAAARPTRCCGV